MKAAAVPSVTGDVPAVMLTTGSGESLILNEALPLPCAPPPRVPPSPVPEAEVSVPSPTLTVSPLLSAVVSRVAVSVSVAVAEALARPVKVTVAFPLLRLA